MQNSLKPFWILLINTLPVVLLAGLLFSEYQTIETLLEEDHVIVWRFLAVSLGLIGLTNLAYALILMARKENISFIYALIAFPVHVVFLYCIIENFGMLVPSSIPRWMVPMEIVQYTGTFLMPTLGFSLFVFIQYLTPKEKDRNPLLSFVGAVGVPLIIYLFFVVLLPIRKSPIELYEIHAIVVIFIVGTTLALFFLGRGVYILVNKKSKRWLKYELAWKIPLALVFPILGLMINNGALGGLGVFEGFERLRGNAIFGDFHGFWFYFLAALNGLVICLPNLEKNKYRLFVFTLRSITLVFTFYFFMVFLPFLPLSVLAIIAVGAGFLMLTPLALMVIHVKVLLTDFKFLRQEFSGKKLVSILVLGCLLIPACLTFRFKQDRTTLLEALEYVYSPNYIEEYDIDTESLRNTLEVLKPHKDKRGSMLVRGAPYISNYFKWLVLDNLTISASKYNKLESVFLGEETFELWQDRVRNVGAEISDLQVESNFDQEQKAWVSWIHLDISNGFKSSFVEYSTTLDLPHGAYISDYYLYVGERKEMGILAEKKAATWLYANIRNTNRDPGILYYLTGNQVGFKVYPFAKEEMRKTGIQVIHKGPIELIIDDRKVVLGEANNELELVQETDHVVYIPASRKAGLKKVHRKPYFHFIVDATNQRKLGQYRERVNKVLSDHQDLGEHAKISLVDTYVTDYDLSDNWDELVAGRNSSTGFFLQRGIETVLYDSYHSSSESYPVIVVLSDFIDHVVLDKNFLDWEFSFPESDRFYWARETGEFSVHSLTHTPREILEEAINFNNDVSVYAYPLDNNEIRYISGDFEPSIVLKEPSERVDDVVVQEKKWDSALQLNGQWMNHVMHPECVDSEWLGLVKGSFESGIMTPSTSYIVVENEAQRAMLKKKQKEVLAGNTNFDLGDEAQRMSEPSWVLLLVLALVFLFIKKKKAQMLS